MYIIHYIHSELRTSSECKNYKKKHFFAAGFVSRANVNNLIQLVNIISSLSVSHSIYFQLYISVFMCLLHFTLWLLLFSLIFFHSLHVCLFDFSTISFIFTINLACGFPCARLTLQFHYVFIFKLPYVARNVCVLGRYVSSTVHHLFLFCEGLLLALHFIYFPSLAFSQWSSSFVHKLSIGRTKAEIKVE